MSQSPPTAQPSTARTIHEVESAIREHVCDPKLRFKLTQDRQKWNQIASSLDVIGDTEQALSAYLSHYAAGPDSGSRYLVLYGVLQALYLQQDAVIHLSEALGGPDRKTILGDKRLRDPRDIRNQATGHPTKKDRPKPVTTHQISRISIGQDGFQMFTADGLGTNQRRTVNVVALIADQRAAVADILNALEKKLVLEGEEARQTFQHERLADLFPPYLGYTFEKLWEATRGQSERFFLGPASLDTLQDVMRAFVDALERRGLGKNAYPGVESWFAEVEHPMQELARFFDASGAEHLHPKTAAIIASHLKAQFDELKGMAAEIDADWRPGAS
jgi:hypothetical protein